MATIVDASERFVLAEDSPVAGNLAALWGEDAELAGKLEGLFDEEGYDVEASKAGEMTIALENGAGKSYLHSRYRPVEEARKLVEGVDVEKAVYAVHGLGLGYHVEALFDRVSDAALVVVLEPDLKLIRTALEHRDYSRLISTGRLIFITEADRGAMLMKLAGHQALVSVGFAFVTHAPSLQVQPAFHAAMQKMLSEYVAFCRTGINTLVLNGRLTCENIARNIAWYVGCPGINELRDRHKGQPAIIVSAGPSLRKNKHLLKEAVGKAVIIAVQTTLQPLLEMGIEPDYVTSLDYHDICTRFFEKLPKGLRTRLVAESKASSAIFSLYPGPISLLGNDFADPLLREMKLGKDRLRAGATVAHLAFYLAEYMGCDPVIFVGQDLGFSDGLCYAPGTSYEDVWRPELGRFCTMEMKQWEHIARERPILRKIEDWEGRGMYTEERLFSYLQQFERDFGVSRAKIIDATEGGARKRGAEVMGLGEAIGRYCGKTIEDGGGREDGGWRMEDGGGLREAIACLERRKAEAGEIERVGRETLPLLEEVKGCLEEEGRANRIIGLIDGLRAKMMGLNEAYQLVTQLTQKTELERYHQDYRIAASGAKGIDLQRRQIERDIVNVRGVIEAAIEFQSLMDEAIGRVKRAIEKGLGI
jgi:hypothetical protein